MDTKLENFRLRLWENPLVYLDMPRNFLFASLENFQAYAQTLIVDGITQPKTDISRFLVGRNS